MKKSTKAALLSGLVFPGLGHLVSRSYYRAGALVLGSAVAMYVVVSITVRQAMAVVDRILNGELDIASSNITELAVATLDPVESQTASYALWIFLLLWLVAIIDAWRLGNTMDKAGMGSE